MSFLTKNTHIPLRSILVLEPYDITWLGIRQMLRTTLGKDVALIRISDTDRLADTTLHHSVDTVLLSAIGHRSEALPLLQQLSLIMRCHKKVHIVAYLRKELPHLVDLLLAFGVDDVFKGAIDAPELVHYLRPAKSDFHLVRFTQQERNVAQCLLAGKSVTRVAQLMHKDVRTISAHKQSLLGKLNMAGRGELQVLGGRLMAEEASA